MNTVVWLVLSFANPAGMSVDFIPFPSATHCQMAAERMEGIVTGKSKFQRTCMTNEAKEAFKRQLKGEKAA